MIDVDRPVIFDCVVDKAENCFPMIPSGKAHNEMILNDYLGETGAEHRRGDRREGQDARLTGGAPRRKKPPEGAAFA